MGEQELREIYERHSQVGWQRMMIGDVQALLAEVRRLSECSQDPVAAEAWGLLCPDCGPNDSAGIVAAVRELKALNAVLREQVKALQQRLAAAYMDAAAIVRSTVAGRVAGWVDLGKHGKAAAENIEARGREATGQ